MSTEISIGKIDDVGFAAWDSFVERTAEATFFHHAGWKTVVEDSFGHDCHYLCALQDDRLVGILPLVHVRSRAFGNALVSTAFCVEGGPVADDAQALLELDKAAQALAQMLNVDYLEYRLRTRRHADWPCNDQLYASFRRSLDSDPERMLMAIPRKRRAMIRKAKGLGLVSEIDESLDRFYPTYATSVRNLGTPVNTRRYYQSLLDVFGSACEVLTIGRGGEAISSVLSFYFRDTVLPYYGGGTDRARDLAGNDFMYWELMRRACERGLKVFDFGRSKHGTGAFAYKSIWGFEPEPLYYEFRLHRAQSVPEINPLNPKYRLFIEMWKRLPLAVANVVGPHIAKNLG